MNSDSSNNMSIQSLRSRSYETEKDLKDIQTMLMEARACTSDWRYWHAGELMWAFFMVACHLNLQDHVRLWHDEKGKLVGFAILGEDPSFDCQVLPEHEWSGIEAEAWVWSQNQLSELRRCDPQQWSADLVSGTRQDDVRRIEFLEQLGFHYRGEFTEVNMLRSLNEPIPEPKIPSGFSVRPIAEVGEVPNRAASHREVWQPWTVGNVTSDDYAYFMGLPGYYRDLDLVAVTPDGVIAAFVNGWIDPLNRIGDFGPVGALPAYRRRGLTRAVLLEGLRRMKEYGMNRVCISTGVSNEPARRLYESVGFRIENQYLDYIKTD